MHLELQEDVNYIVRCIRSCGILLDPELQKDVTFLLLKNPEEGVSLVPYPFSRIRLMGAETRWHRNASQEPASHFPENISTECV